MKTYEFTGTKEELLDALRTNRPSVIGKIFVYNKAKDKYTRLTSALSRWHSVGVKGNGFFINIHVIVS